jgi:uncharacterized protein YjdB
MKSTRLMLFPIVVLTVLISGCGGDHKQATLNTLTLSAASLSPAAGLTTQLRATGTYSDGSTQPVTNVTWSSSDSSVATVDRNGLVTTKKPGTVTITATSGTVHGAVIITVGQSILASLSLSPSNPSVALGLGQTISVTGTMTDGSTATGLTLTWTSSNTSVATVENGVITTKGQGSTTITVSCGSVSASTTLTVAAPALASITISPKNPSAKVGDPLQFSAAGTMTDGTAASGVTINWSSSSPSVASIDASGLATAKAEGNTTITASSGSISDSTTLSIMAAENPVPTIASLTPSSITAGGADFSLTVNGTGFVAGSSLQWNGTPKTTTFVSATQLTAAIAASDVASSGTVSVAVVNPAPGGGVSEPAVFTINPAASAPHITSLSPSTVIAGGPAFTLTIEGTGFVNGSVVNWNGTPRSTTYVSATQLSASISSADISATGTASVTVANPDTLTSDPVQLTISAQTVGLFEQVSVATDGTSGTSTYFAQTGDYAITPDRRFVVFYSNASNLVVGDSNQTEDTFVRDTCYGSTGACVPSTIRVSVASDGTEKLKVNEGHSGVAITPDGRYIAFTSVAANLVPGDTNAAMDVFVRDTCVGASAGCTPSTIRASVATDGSQGNGYYSQNPAISADGRYVAFESDAVLVAGATSHAVYVRDTCIGAPAGCSPTTSLVSRSDVSQVGGPPDISADGRYIAYSVYDGTYPDFMYRVYLFDTCNGAAVDCSPSTVQVSTNPDGAPNTRNSTSPSMSANGRYVAYFYNASSGGTILVRDTCVGAPDGCTPSTTMADVAYDGSAPSRGAENPPSLSPDGRFVMFSSAANNLVAGTQRGSWDIYVRDTCLMSTLTNCTPSNVRVSVMPDGSLFPADKSFGNVSTHSLSQDGHVAVFPYNSQLYLWLTSF